MIILIGGGNDLHRAFKLFLSSLRGKTVVYITHAREKYDLSWIKQFVDVDLIIPENLSDLKDISQVDGLIIGGGNVFRLASEIRKSDISDWIRKQVSDGASVIGNSAGALILGKIIRHASYFDVLVSDESLGLDILNGYSIWPHFLVEHLAFISDLDYPLYLIPENDFVILYE